jgi:osmotically-inducible protein OsmY
MDATDRARQRQRHALVNRVKKELLLAPDVDGDAVAVVDDGGRLTLRGTVGSMRERRGARRAAERVWGVVDLDNRLQVSPALGA